MALDEQRSNRHRDRFRCLDRRSRVGLCGCQTGTSAALPTTVPGYRICTRSPTTAWGDFLDECVPGLLAVGGYMLVATVLVDQARHT